MSPPRFSNPWLHRFALLTVVLTWALIWVGGFVTSTESGLAVPDWPLSYGMLMPPMVGGIFYEHGHRMVASLVGLLTVVLALWLGRAEERRWLRRLGFVALAIVIMQGLLGGLTVIYLLPTPISASHATLAQTFFCVTILIAFATSREWQLSARGKSSGDLVSPSLHLLALATSLAIFLQLVLGAFVRHTGAWSAIPDFPLAFGRLVPPLGEFPVVLHFAHRLWGMVVTGLVLWLSVRCWRARGTVSLRWLAAAMSFLVLAQVLLGGSIVWTGRHMLAATGHVATGALLLGVSWLCLLRVYLHMVPRSVGASPEAAAKGRRELAAGIVS